MAGCGAAARWAPRVAAAFTDHGWHPDVRRSASPGDERHLAAAAARVGHDLVVAVGGDGTVHHVANGLLDAGTDAVLGHIPVGTGNDFARLTGLTARGVAGSVATLVRGVERRFDVGRANGEWFVNALGVGFGAEVVRRTLPLRRYRGFPLYLTGALQTFGTFRAPVLRIDADGVRRAGPVMLIEVAIGVTGGGGFRFTPDARPDDGLFDVCLIEQVGWARFLLYLPRVMRGTHGRLPPVTLFRTPFIDIAGPGDPLTVHLDGELLSPAATKLRAEIYPGRLRVLCAR
jgi:YegS/Rv2252/BmrU family lipid kinase